jgi:hypothetical protein
MVLFDFSNDKLNINEGVIMNNSTVEEMTDAQIDEEIIKLKKVRKERKDRGEKLAGTKIKIDAILAGNGLSKQDLKDIYPELLKSNKDTKKSTKKKSSLAGKKLNPIWMNPDDPSQTTAARGNKPKWLKVAIETHGEDACKINQEDAGSEGESTINEVDSTSSEPESAVVNEEDSTDSEDQHT